MAGRSRESCQTAADGDCRDDRPARAARSRPTSPIAPHVERLARRRGPTLGPVDILINNAGINIRGPVQDLTEEDLDAVIDTNLKGPFLCSRAVRSAHGEARMGACHQHGLDPERHRDAGPDAVRVVEGRRR